MKFWKSTKVSEKVMMMMVMVMMMMVKVTATPSQHYTTLASHHRRYASVVVWCGTQGWQLNVDSCHPQHHPYTTRCGGMDELQLVREGWRIPEPVATPPAHPGATPPPTPGGITLNVLNQRSGLTVFHKIFPLAQYWAHWADLKWHLERVAPGRLVVMTVAVSGTVGLRNTNQLLAQLGSLFALHLTPMAHWTWTFIKGGRTISETTILQGYTTHHTHVIMPLSHLATPSTSNKNGQQVQEQRWHYCNANGAMGGLCNEYTPDPLPVPSPPPVTHQSVIARVPVVVTAGNRHQYLYHTLTTLMNTPGAQHDNIIVVLGNATQAATQLLHLMNINFTTLTINGHHNNKLFSYYRDVFKFVAHTFPEAPAVILLDEDVEVSPDFFSYMSQTLWLLHEDPSLYCINAYSATGFQGTAYDSRTVLRARVQVEWGYAVSLQFIKDAIRKWPSDFSKVDTVFYDEWLYKHQSNGRECVFPEVSRSFHFGMGVNTEAWSTETYFLFKPLVKRPHVHLDNVSTLLLETWQEHFSHSIRHATPLTGNPCSETFVPPVNTTTNFVFYYRMLRELNGKPNYRNFFFAAKCLNAWSASEQGLHKRVLTVRVSMLATLYLVGAPYSPYAHFRPHHIKPWDYDSVTDEEDDIIINRIKTLEMGRYQILNLNVTSEYLMNILFVN